MSCFLQVIFTILSPLMLYLKLIGYHISITHKYVIIRAYKLLKNRFLYYKLFSQCQDSKKVSEISLNVSVNWSTWYDHIKFQYVITANNTAILTEAKIVIEQNFSDAILKRTFSAFLLVRKEKNRFSYSQESNGFSPSIQMRQTNALFQQFLSQLVFCCSLIGSFTKLSSRQIQFLACGTFMTRMV